MPKAAEGENDLDAMESRLQLDVLFGVKDKVVVVTGGGSGIGAMIAMGFVKNGAKVYIVSRKDTSSFAKEMEARGSGKCVALQGDLGTDDGIAAFAKEMEKREPNGVHVLINNSGTNWGQTFDDYSPEAWDKVYALNVKAVFNLTRMMAPSLEKAVETSGAASRVINIASVDAYQISALDTYAYSSGKAAVVHLSRVLAGKLGDRRITVNAVCPGPFPSRMMRATLERAGDAIKDSTVIGRVGEAPDMAGVCLYLSSPAGSFVTGASIVVDGGLLVRPSCHGSYGSKFLVKQQPGFKCATDARTE